ncbi:anthranilate synthase component I [Mollisia scopiformis]|uniref:Anthranilate synthase component I n=1 Tax=Mollisia scopiformis TaxID=149040 RepID=A0A194XWD7_MOLSC|nr:anthranilate synthase component I [Mollisia scopiformis]KUJ24446.1 anthranilate synthase component I [Mollisia scopiformis]
MKLHTGAKLPPLIGGAIGYVGYNCVKYFEPKTKRDLKDIVQIPESLFMLFDTIIAVDHFFQQVNVFTYVKAPGTPGAEASLEEAYASAQRIIEDVVSRILVDKVPRPPQGPIQKNLPYESNIGQVGYEAHVSKLKEHICKGDIIQAVPSQRVTRRTSLHPFNVYRRLRTVNPSPYLFFIDCDEFQIIGASPELLVKSEKRRVSVHLTAGTVRLGATTAEDDALADGLKGSIKDRAEHVMLVDLARNDVNRICDPLTVRVDRLIVVRRFSHVQHLTSEVSGILRPNQTRFDAFRSVFPGGTVSGAPKVRAMELISELEKETRGVYGGAVGYFGYNTVSDGAVEEGDMDTCIALRTMVMKKGTVYLQAGGGIVYDSNEYEEYVETMNKLRANMICIDSAEALFASQS